MSACEDNALGENTMDPRYKETRIRNFYAQLLYEFVHMSACEVNAEGENTMDPRYKETRIRNF